MNLFRVKHFPPGFLVLIQLDLELFVDHLGPHPNAHAVVYAHCAVCTLCIAQRISCDLASHKTKQNFSLAAQISISSATIICFGFCIGNSVF